MAYTELVYELLKKDLTAPRILLEQVLTYINDQFGYPSSELPRFFQEKFPTLEDYEVDLAFSPQYTPSEHNRLEYIPLLGEHAFSASELGILKGRLNELGLKTLFSAPDIGVEVEAPVHEVFIERYVNLLKLDHKIPEGLYRLLLEIVPSASHHEVNLLLREDIWKNDQKRHILVAFLKIFQARQNFSSPKVSFLTNFVKTYRPDCLLDMDRQLESLIQSCNVDMENVQGRGFHDEYLKAMNVGNSLTKNTERDIWDHYKHMIDMATQLKDDYARMPEQMPDLILQAQ